jgi:hypothetical protein
LRRYKSNRLRLIAGRKRPTLTSFHSTPPGSLSLLQVSFGGGSHSRRGFTSAMKPDEPCGGPISSDRPTEWADPFAEQAHANRTSFAPETTSPKRNERIRNRTKAQQKQQSRPIFSRSYRSGCRFESCRATNLFNVFAHWASTENLQATRNTPGNNRALFAPGCGASTTVLNELWHPLELSYFVGFRHSFRPSKLRGPHDFSRKHKSVDRTQDISRRNCSLCGRFRYPDRGDDLPPRISSCWS